MTAKEKPKIPLPKDWTGNVRSAVLHVISLAQYATAYTRSWAANSPNERMRLKTENDRLEAEVALIDGGDPHQGCPAAVFGFSQAPAVSADRTDGDSGITRCTALVKAGNGRFLPSHTGYDHPLDASSG